MAVWQEVAHVDTGAAEKGRKEGRKERSQWYGFHPSRERGSGGVPTKENVETERLSAQANDASLPWQRRISGLPGNG